MTKGERLGEIVGQLNGSEAVRLARAVELARLRGKEELPTDLVLAALRPRLREARAARVPTLCRLITASFEHFLVDREDEPRLPGRIARAALTPWWQALGIVAGAELAGLEERLKSLHARDAAGSIEEFVAVARTQVAGWTAALAAELAHARPNMPLRKFFPRLGLIDDVKAIATLLSLAEPLTAAFAEIDRVLAIAGKLDGRQIVDLIPEAVTAAKQHYLAITDADGMNSVYLALALLNRLRYPWQILRLGRALSWKPNDSLLRDTEFGAVGERLIMGLTHTAQDIARFAGADNDALEILPMMDAITEYMEDAEGLLGEFGFRRDSPWGESILQTRIIIADAVGREFLHRLGQHILQLVLPVGRRAGLPRGATPDPDLRQGPTEAAIAQAVAAARLLMLVLHRGQRHGFGQPAHEVIEMLEMEIDRRTSGLLDALRHNPGDEAAAAQIAGAVQVLDVLFEDGRGTTLSRRAGLARQAKA